ncbi:MAG: hypothetical protein DRJ01_05595 [Bacteroidetes bacterium]|nr:MAG: hypothetical protein DRJ01_05595 [Bacteroidota bacterium]
MKKTNFKWISSLLLMAVAIFAITLNSCKKDDEPEPDPIASFQYEVSETNYLEVTFTNYSTNATSYSWDFGDQTGTSTEKDPVYTYTAAGNYTVVLTATNADGKTANYSKAIEITDPNAALALLAGQVSKTWKLYREPGVAVGGCGADAENHRGWWGLQNDGSRPCVFYHEFTFARDGSFTFDDKGKFWGEAAIFDGTDLKETCFEAVAANMVNKDGVDVSAWLSGTHQFEYDPNTGDVTLTGNGAWMGLPQLGTSAESIVPEASKTFKISIEEKEGFDLLTIVYSYDGIYWDFDYACYDNPDDEPDVVEEEPPYGEDLPDLTPTEMWNTFETATSFVLLDTAAVYPGTGTAANGGMVFTMGVDDPAGVGVNVGQYDRAGTYQELQFMMQNDIQFDNFTKVSLDVYMPSTNDYSGTLTKGISIIIGEASQTNGWWNGHTQYDTTAVSLDEWHTYTFNLDEPTSAGLYDPHTRTDLDFFAISLGGGGHDATGTFYIRNFKFE